MIHKMQKGSVQVIQQSHRHQVLKSTVGAGNEKPSSDPCRPLPLFLHPIQAKSVVNEPDDPYEREADQIAHTVVERLQQPSELSTSPTIQKAEALPHPSSQILQALKTNNSAFHSVVQQVIQGGGQPISSALQGNLEQAFGEEDLSYVQLHQDPLAIASAKAIGAQAYTIGHHIIGQITGPEILAHELQHIRQQRYPVSYQNSPPFGALPVTACRHPKIQRVVTKNGVIVTLDELDFLHDNGLIDTETYLDGLFHQNTDYQLEIGQRYAPSSHETGFLFNPAPFSNHADTIVSSESPLWVDNSLSIDLGPPHPPIYPQPEYLSHPVPQMRPFSSFIFDSANEYEPFIPPIDLQPLISESSSISSAPVSHTASTLDSHVRPEFQEPFVDRFIERPSIILRYYPETVSAGGESADQLEIRPPASPNSCSSSPAPARDATSFIDQLSSTVHHYPATVTSGDESADRLEIRPLELPNSCSSPPLPIRDTTLHAHRQDLSTEFGESSVPIRVDTVDRENVSSTSATVLTGDSSHLSDVVEQDGLDNNEEFAIYLSRLGNSIPQVSKLTGIPPTTLRRRIRNCTRTITFSEVEVKQYLKKRNVFDIEKQNQWMKGENNKNSKISAPKGSIKQRVIQMLLDVGNERPSVARLMGIHSRTIYDWSVQKRTLTDAEKVELREYLDQREDLQHEISLWIEGKVKTKRR